MNAVAKNEPALEDLIHLLSDGRFLTAVQITELTGCSKPTAHKWIKELQGRGLTLATKIVREGQKGPLSRAYALSPATRKMTVA